jgi:hypothetical protein
MSAYPTANISPTALLAAALELAEVHGRPFAECFLQEHGIDESVICELLDEMYTGAYRRRYSDSPIPASPR